MLKRLRTKRRYVAYFCLLLNAYIETCARFGVSIAMIGGMVKEDCDDPKDEGTFCWSENTQALVLGAYFYGHTAQCLTTFIANRFTGFTLTYRFWLIASAVIQLCCPIFAKVSASLVIVTQTLRGFLAGIMVAYHFDYISKFSVGKENKALISIIGANDYIGRGTGGLIAGLVTRNLGWQFYFYLTGAAYLLGLLLNLVFVQDSPENSWYLNEQKKDLMLKNIKTADLVIANENNTNLPVEQGNTDCLKPTEDSREDGSKSDCDKVPTNTNKYNMPDTNDLEEVSKEMKKEEERTPLKDLICRVYLLAFCIYIPAYNLIYFNLLNVVPFYLNKVLGAEPLFISSLNVGLSILIAFCTLIFSYIFHKLDRIMSWLKCRMIFALLPMVLQIVALVALTLATTITGSVASLILSAIAAATLFSGSVYTINYEIDPKNSAFLVSIFNSFGQVSGFLGPIMMAAITTTNPNIPDYESVYKKRWAYFFYTVAGVAAAGFVAIVGAYLIKPSEWVNRDREKRQ